LHPRDAIGRKAAQRRKEIAITTKKLQDQQNESVRSRLSEESMKKTKLKSLSIHDMMIWKQKHNVKNMSKKQMGCSDNRMKQIA